MSGSDPQQPGAENLVPADGSPAGGTDERFRLAFEASPIGMALVATDGRWLRVNPSLCRIIGYSEQELLARTFQDIMHLDDVEADVGYADQLLTGTADHYRTEKRYLHASGHTVWVNLTVSLVRDDDGNPLYFISQMEDITERHQAEEVLTRESALVGLLQRVATAANEGETFEEAAAVCVKEVCALTGWPVGHVYRRDEDPSSFRPCDVWWVADAERFESFRAATTACRLAADQGIVGRVVATGAPEWVDDITRTDFPRAGAALEAGLRATLAFPVLLDGEVVAVLEFFSPEAQQRDDALLETMRLVGSQLGRVCERDRDAEALRASEARNRRIIETSHEAFIAIDESGIVTDWNRQAAHTFGWEPQEAVGRLLADLVIPPALRATHQEALKRYRSSGQRTIVDQLIELPARHRDGREFPVELTISAVEERDHTIFHAFLRDISARKKAEHEMQDSQQELARQTVELRHRAFHDPLTNLANRVLFLDRVQHAQKGRRAQPLAVLMLDLDGFKAVNDALGHAVGDVLLVDVARRLSRCIRPADTAARFGGDEFAILLQDIKDGAEARSVADRVLRAFHEPFDVAGRELFVGLSIGVVVSEPSAEEAAEELVRRADLALYAAKAGGRSRYEVFHPAMHALAMARLELGAELRRSVARGELVLHYQPIRTVDGGTVGLEALVRWRHPTRGLVAPNDFIPIAEENGMIVPIGEWVIRQACLQVRAWQEAHHNAAGLAVSVNLSGRQLQLRRLPEVVAATLSDAGLAPQHLVLDVTETLIMDGGDVTAQNLKALSELGVKLAIDDFGTGYSSLARLHTAPVDFIKVDQSFIQRMDGGGDDEPLVAAMIVMAHGLGVEVIAEGVETPEQLAFLSAHDCDGFQGFLAGRPVEAAGVDGLLDPGCAPD